MERWQDSFYNEPTPVFCLENPHGQRSLAGSMMSVRSQGVRLSTAQPECT